MSVRSVVFAAPVRTAIGTFGGSLKDIAAPELGAVAIAAATKRTGLELEEWLNSASMRGPRKTPP